MAEDDDIPIDPALEHPELVVKKFVIAKTEVSFLVPRRDQNNNFLGHQEVGFTMDELPPGLFRTQVLQLIRRVLEREGLVEPLP